MTKNTASGHLPTDHSNKHVEKCFRLIRSKSVKFNNEVEGKIQQGDHQKGENDRKCFDMTFLHHERKEIGVVSYFHLELIGL